MKNVKYYYRLNFNLNWKNPAKVKLSAGESERQKGQQNPLQWWGDVSSCGRPVQRRSRSLPWPAEKITTDTSACPDRTAGNMPQGTILLLGRGWPKTEALKGKIWELRCELVPLGQRQHFQATPAPRAWLGCLGCLLCHSFVHHKPLLALFAGFGVGIVDTLGGSAPELRPQEAQ